MNDLSLMWAGNWYLCSKGAWHLFPRTAWLAAPLPMIDWLHPYPSVCKEVSGREGNGCLPVPLTDRKAMAVSLSLLLTTLSVSALLSNGIHCLVSAKVSTGRERERKERRKPGFSAILKALLSNLNHRGDV